MTEEQRANLPPSVLVVFGVTGNLSANKLLPAIYQLLKNDRLPADFFVVGVFQKTSMSLDSLMQQVEINILRSHKDCDPEILARLRALIRPIIMDSTDIESYHHLRQLLEELDHEKQLAHQRLFYLAIPPSIFKAVITCLGDSGINSEENSPSRRIFVEKPFGTDLANAQELIDHISQHFQEHQVYRIDHYLAKETAQNILTFRFNNPIIEDLWGRQFIDHIQITASQQLDIEGRVSFYEGMGALRDIAQSHLLQLMSLIMMEAPEKLESESIHQEKLALLEAVEPIKDTHVDEVSVRGQYEGYRHEVGNDTSTTETYAALKLEVANSRWGGVPVLLRTGKAMDKASTEINVVFKERSRRDTPSNVLTIRIQPNEGIAMRLTAKKPGFTNDLQPVDMDFAYDRAFQAHESPEAYERVLVDAISGDQTLFATSDEVIKSWQILQPVLEQWQNSQDSLRFYPKGSSGPTDADDLARSFGCDWLS